MCISKNVLILQIILTALVVRYKTHTPTQQFYKHVSLLHEDQCPKPTGILYWCITSKIHRYPVKYNGNYSTSLYRIALLIIAGIETNPGPRPPKYPCGTCSKACKWGEKALACDECDTWYHASCAGINTQEYSRLANSSVSWYCMICDAPNHSTVLYDLLDSAESNTY